MAHNLGGSLLLLLCLGSHLASAQYGEYGYGPYDYPDEGYGTYFSDYDDVVDYWEGVDDMFAIHEPDCAVLPSGRVKVNGTKACDVRISGSNGALTALNGGLDGLYVLNNCYDGRPSYTREGSPSGEGRMIFYDSFYQDWGIKRDDGIPPKTDEDLLAFGGFGVGEERPQIVEEMFWLLNQTFTTQKSDDPEFPWVNAGMKVKCENDRGVKVDFEGEVQTPQFTPHPSAHEISSKSSKANDDFYSRHSSASEATGGHGHHKHSVALQVFYGLLVVSCLAGAAYFGWSVFVNRQRSVKGFAGTLGSASDYPPDIDMTATPIAADSSAYSAPSLEETPLMSGEEPPEGGEGGEHQAGV